MACELTVSDIIQLVSIGVALLLGIFSIIFSVISLRQNSKIIKESNMAQIEIFPFKIYGDIVPRIKIQNFGKTTGIITNVIVIPSVPDDAFANPFEYYKNLSIAPNQSFTMLFTKNGEPKPPLEEFDIEITYKTLDEVVKSKQHINYKYLNGYNETSTDAKDVNKELNKINRSIQGLLQK